MTIDFLRGEEGAVAVEAEGVTYQALRARVAALSTHLRAGAASLAGERVAFLAQPSAAYVEALLGIIHAGGVAVPLSPLHPEPELAHILDVATPKLVLATAEMAPRLAGRQPLLLGDFQGAAPAAPGGGLMLFTSGTTGKPKGVSLPDAAVAATCASLHDAWGWRADDRLLHVLPLHHTHGVIVALLGALWAGARVRFEPRATWDLVAEATVFMAVPTIYARLLESFRGAGPDEQRRWREGASRLRLFTSGSAALPAAAFEAFRAATGQTILERYGMTEIGMALSNPLEGPRVPGAVGRPLPGVIVDIIADGERPALADEPGELRVRSPQLFSGYQGDPEATARSYDAQGRFRTGDTGVRDGDGVIRLLGRTSTDILKSGGYKLSALEIEETLREHPAIAEVAVIGRPDEVWGDRVTACLVIRPGAQPPTAEDLRAWARDRLASYKLPREVVLIDELPRNAMGKVMKGRLR